MINKENKIDNKINKANTIYIWLALFESGQHKSYMVSDVLILLTEVGDIDFLSI